MKAENECRHRIKYLLACISGFIPRCQDEITWRETTSSHIRDGISEGHIHQILFLNGFDKKKENKQFDQRKLCFAFPLLRLLLSAACNPCS